ncbi:hypothetical protein CN575_26195 [Bacillus wiedmannii]|nr:hypothetical protein CN604_04220 [Bacillus wiedmannii]PEN99637.1 hypothetical protein CN556_00975 [Bacillus wiedmannii]PEP29623.1 hypothetical protein CN575_26195 [Bacillus wiedmannii]PGB68051.1 hypothetical protein COM15_21250 [Bacillus wiedmannii]PHF33364.1 hypothetical protein COF82_05430 [Bacillus wiedmannii]
MNQIKRLHQILHLLRFNHPQLPCIDFVMSYHFYPALMGSKTPTSKFSESKEVRWGINCP